MTQMESIEQRLQRSNESLLSDLDRLCAGWAGNSETVLPSIVQILKTLFQRGDMLTNLCCLQSLNVILEQHSKSQSRAEDNKSITRLFAECEIVAVLSSILSVYLESSQIEESIDQQLTVAFACRFVGYMAQLEIFWPVVERDLLSILANILEQQIISKSTIGTVAEGLLDALGMIASSSQLCSVDSLLPIATLLAKWFRQLTGEQSIPIIRCLAAVVDASDPKHETEIRHLIATLTNSFNFDNSLGAIISRLAMNSFDDIKIAGITILRALCRNWWGCEALLTNSVFMENFLFNRNLENSYPAKMAKFELVKTIVENSSQSDANIELEVLSRLQRYIADGPFYQRAEYSTAIEPAT